MACHTRLWSTPTGAGLTALLLMLSACAGLSPQADETAALAVPVAWQAGQAAGAGASQPDELAAWWQRFDDPALGLWAERAGAGSPRAAAAEAAWRQSVAQRDLAAAALSPSLGTSASAGRDAAGSGSTRSSTDRLQLGLQASWAPDISGGARLALAAAEATERARRASLGDVQVQLAGEAALAYIELRGQQARLVLAQDTLASRRQTLQIIRWRQEAGLVSALETDQARTATAQAEALVPLLQTAVAQARHALALLAGVPYTGVADSATSTDASNNPARPAVPAADDDLALDIPAQTLRQRADVRAAEHEVAAALLRVGQAQAQRWPSFALAGQIGLSALSFGALGDGASLVSSLLASVSLPLFDGGARRAEVRVQQAALDGARAQHRGTVLGALKAVEDALVALQGDRVRLVALRTAATAAASAATLAGQRFASGLADYAVVLETQRTAFSAQDAVLGAQADLARDHVLLYRALGGGWRSDETRTASASRP